MAIHIQEEGHYELFETTRGHRILVLDDALWFAWVEGQQGEILVWTDTDHQKSHTLQRGRFVVADFEDDPNYRDMPHLFLKEEQGPYQELVLPKGLPTEDDDRKKIIATDNRIAADELETYLDRPEATRGGSDLGGTRSAGDVAEHLEGVDFPARREELVRQARGNNAPPEVVDRLERLDEDTYTEMAEVRRALGGNRAPSDLPIQNYEALTVEEVMDRLDTLREEEIQTLRRYESAHKNRKTLQRAFDRRLRPAAG